MEELRSEIWDYLFQASGSQALDTIARVFARDLELIRRAVDHEWFNVMGSAVAIAYRGGSHPPNGSTVVIHETN